jgi:predicted ATPase
VGKSTLFDAFGFLSDCSRLGVEEACDSKGRGGFERIRSQGIREPIEFEIYYREDAQSRPITYEVAIDVDEQGRPYVARERLRQRRRRQSHGRPFSFFILNSGQGFAWRGETGGVQEVDRVYTLEELKGLVDEASQPEERAETDFVELDDARKLGISTLGSLKQHPRISAFRRFIED